MLGVCRVGCPASAHQHRLRKANAMDSNMSLRCTGGHQACEFGGYHRRRPPDPVDTRVLEIRPRRVVVGTPQ